MRATWAFLLLLVSAHKPSGGALLRKALLKGRESFPRFETLEECEKAYEELLTGNTMGEVAVEPRYVEKSEAKEESTEAPTTAAPTEAPRIKAAPVGEATKVEAEKTYLPPNSAGKPSNDGWDYGHHGDDWGADAEACSGDKQSPIDIVKFVDIAGQTKSVLWFDYYADPRLSNTSKSTLENNGHGLMLDDPSLDLGYVKLGASEYEAYEYEFHAPSEHTIDGSAFPLELQILHKDAKGNMLGVSVLFKYGPSNPFLASIKTAVPEMPVWDQEKGTGKATVTGEHPDFFDLEAVLPVSKIHPGKDLTFYNYEGSLTQPPCTQGVDWWVTAEAQDATKEEILHIRNSIMSAKPTKKGNNRNAQALNSRTVLVGHTGFQHHVKMWKHKPQFDASKHWKDERGYNTQDAPWVAPKEEEAKEEAKE
jgi:carbonic anhydrase